MGIVIVGGDFIDWIVLPSSVDLCNRVIIGNVTIMPFIRL